ncbi:hypothetical protein SAY87_014585 [Trapa incisa]|uniref:Uncharacterized protein n=1 Tax=Trapa incisa TaxID=236973 RepID=A0AAN7JKI2_9MYRT|nr:hypothetical protein SAY87_014585 [Trapa incisa]
MISATLMRKRRGRFQLDEDKGSSTPFPSINQNPLYSRHERNYVAVEADSDDDPPPGALHVLAEQTPQDKNEAQQAILDYLQSDRGLNFTDVEHIGKNSPRFLVNLLSNIKDKKDAFRSMMKLLRNKMEKILKEAMEIFWYKDGVLALRLRAYGDLGLKRSAVVNLTSPCQWLLIDSNKLPFVKFLEKPGNLGIENDSILRYV